MFKQNKYTRWYYALVESRQHHPCPIARVEERHHILPRSLGGSDDPENLVLLTPREHFVAHRLLVKMTTGIDKRKMTWALHRMAFSNGRYVATSYQYQAVRVAFIDMLRSSTHYKEPRWRQTISDRVSLDWDQNEERRKKTSERLKETWRQGKLTAEQSRKNGHHNQFGKLNHNARVIEYKGQRYYGWRELQEATGVTKALYRKYYLNGLDPEPRIGTDGPVPRNETR